MDRVYWNIEDALEAGVIYKEIDWHMVNSIVNPEIERSRKWLKDAIEDKENKEDKENHLFFKKILR